METKMYDVVAVNIETSEVQLMAENKTLKNAEAIVSMAVMRCGLDDCFYAEAPAGKYKQGDKWKAE